MTPTDEPDPPPTGQELRAERLGFALRVLATELVDERRKVAQLRQQVANLQAQLDVAEADRASNPKPTID